jgi:broad specificity phosphatase PhoE
MTDVLLIRHAMCDPVGRAIAGRAAGVHLNPAGWREARELADRLPALPLAALFSSSLERARETAEPLAARQRFNSERGTTRIPGGESMSDVVTRAVGELAAMAAEYPDRLVAAVTHGDVIRALIAHYAGMPLDHMLRLEVSPASVSVVRLGGEPRVIALNWRVHEIGDLEAG